MKTRMDTGLRLLLEGFDHGLGVCLLGMKTRIDTGLRRFFFLSHSNFLNFQLGMKTRIDTGLRLQIAAMSLAPRVS